MPMPPVGGGWRFVLGPVRARTLPGRPVAPARAGRIELVFVAPARPLRHGLEVHARRAQERPRTAHDTVVLRGNVVGGVELASATKTDRHRAWGRLRVPGRRDLIEEWRVGAARTRRARRRPWLRFHREDKVRTVPARTSCWRVTPLPLPVAEVRAALGGRSGSRVCATTRRRCTTPRGDRSWHCRVVGGHLPYFE